MVIQSVPLGQLYGGKICASLDRQHPRDLFDIKYLLENEGLSREVIIGFIFALLSSDRPIHEILQPNLLDQRNIMENQFEGMSTDIFTYEDFEQTRIDLISSVKSNLTLKDKNFLLRFITLDPDWTIHDFSKFPAISWKLHNLESLKDSNPYKFHQQLVLLKEHFGL